MNYDDIVVSKRNKKHLPLQISFTSDNYTDVQLNIFLINI